jgi:hypothetical protein
MKLCNKGEKHLNNVTIQNRSSNIKRFLKEVRPSLVPFSIMLIVLLTQGLSAQSNAELYRSGMQAYKENRFYDSVAILKRISTTYLPLHVNYWIAKNYDKLGDNNNSIRYYEACLLLQNDWHDYLGYIFFSLADLYNLQGRYRNTLTLRARAEAYFAERPHPMNKPYASRLSAAMHEEFFEALYDDDPDLAQRLYQNLYRHVLATDTEVYEQEFGPDDGRIFSESLDFYRINSWKSEAVIHRIQVNFIRNCDTFTHAEERLREQQRFSDQEIADYQNVFRVMEKVYQFLSGGTLKLEFKIHVIESTVTELQRFSGTIGKEKNAGIKFNVQSLKPWPYDHFSRAIEDYDTIIMIVPSRLMGTSYGSLAPIPLSPDNFSSESRGYIQIGALRGRNPMTMIHEFFHVLEARCKIGPIHGFKEIYKDSWPSWYSGQGQLYWYQQQFSLAILPKGIERTIMRSNRQKK